LTCKKLRAGCKKILLQVSLEYAVEYYWHIYYIYHLERQPPSLSRQDHNDSLVPRRVLTPESKIRVDTSTTSRQLQSCQTAGGRNYILQQTDHLLFNLLRFSHRSINKNITSLITAVAVAVFGNLLLLQLLVDTACVFVEIF
jgi:hypothetical protein